MTAPKKRVLVPVADGSEDIETSCIYDVLVRAEIEVTLSSVMPESRTLVTLARGMKVQCATHIDSETPEGYDAIILPGGMPGSGHLGGCKHLIGMMQVLKEQGKLIGAMCAAPVFALAPNGLLNGVEKATCFPMLKDKMPEGTAFDEATVVFSNGVITSQAPGTALAFGLNIAKLLVGEEVATKVGAGMLVPHF